MVKRNLGSSNVGAGECNSSCRLRVLAAAFHAEYQGTWQKTPVGSLAPRCSHVSVSLSVVAL